MKIINLRFIVLAVTLLFQTSITRAGDKIKSVPPSNPFVILLEGTYGPAGVVRDLGLVLPDLNNGIYVTVPIYNLDSGVPGPTDKPVGSFYALGGEDDLVAYDLGKGALTARFVGDDTVVTPDGSGGIFITGTYELDILEATGIYQSFAGGHIHMVDVLQVTATGLFVEHCFCIIRREHGKP
jgi:hypothetical protein